VSGVKDYLGPARVPFLVLAPACALVGLGTAVHSGTGVKALHVVIAFAGAIAAHVSVNAFNEWFDFRSGLDARTKRTPFSGGSGVLPRRPELAAWAFALAAASMGFTALVGVYFLWVRGPWLLPLGLLGLVVIFAYTPLFARVSVVGLVAPGLGFGPLMVMGVHFALTGAYSWTAFVASLVPFFLVNDLLLLNQFPDVEADRSAGRRNLPITIGRRRSSLVYGAFILGAFASIVAGVALGLLPVMTLIGLGALVVAVPAAVGARRHADELDALTPYLGLNVVTNLLTPVLVAVGLMVGKRGDGKYHAGIQARWVAGAGLRTAHGTGHGRRSVSMGEFLDIGWPSC